MNLQEQLQQLNSAIHAIENGAQEYRIGSRQIRKPDLSLLYRERRLLLQQIEQDNGGGVYVASFDRR